MRVPTASIASPAEAGVRLRLEMGLSLRESPVAPRGAGENSHQCSAARLVVALVYTSRALSSTQWSAISTPLEVSRNHRFLQEVSRGSASLSAMIRWV